MSEPSILDARLAEIDRRLRTIQSGLTPPPEEVPPAATAAGATGATAPDEPLPSSVSEPRPSAAREPLSPPPTPLRAVAAPPPLAPAEEADRLITRLRGLIDEHERLLGETRDMLAADPSPVGATISVSAGPLLSTAQLRTFGERLQALPGVRRVAVREFVGGDRAVIDVHLAGPIS